MYNLVLLLNLANFINIYSKKEILPTKKFTSTNLTEEMSKYFFFSLNQAYNINTVLVPDQHLLSTDTIVSVVTFTCTHTSFTLLSRYDNIKNLMWVMQTA